MKNNNQLAAKNSIKELLVVLDNRENPSNELLDITDVLRQVYETIDKTKNPEALVNRLVNYIRSMALKGKIHFPADEEKLMMDLAEIGEKVGINGLYMANFSDKSQFFSSFDGNKVVYRS